MRNYIKRKKGENKMKKPSKEEMIELVMLLIATAVGVLVFSTAIVIATEIIRAVF